jgi:hypothetical protein
MGNYVILSLLMPWIFDRMLAFKTWLLECKKRIFTRRQTRSGFVVFASLFLMLVGRPVHAQSLFNPDQILQNFADIAFSLASALTKAIVLMIDVLIPIMLYNDFTTNPVVSAGWAIMRDTVNMFFVIVLIVIAFGTIFGHSKFKWQQQVPKLLIFAVVINFSKTLAGIMIDFGQVIMLTFANALREIAAGNFIQMLGLNRLYSANASWTLDNVGAGTAFDYFAASVMSVILTLWVLATLVILVAILLFRIVMLWVLIVIAPLTWFVGGAKDIIGSNAYAEWWSEFKCLVAVGPVITFFLWLTLAVAGAGEMAASSGFDVSSTSNNAAFATELLGLEHFLSFLIGMAMLFAGFKAATQMCSGMSGKVIGGLVGKAQSGALQRTALGLAARGGAVVGRAAGKGIYKAPGAIGAGLKYAPGGAWAGKKFDKVRRGLRTAPSALIGDIGGALNIGSMERYGRSGESKEANLAAQRKAADVTSAGEAFTGLDRKAKSARVKTLLASKTGSSSVENESLAALGLAMGDKRLQKEMKDDGTLEQLWNKHGGKYQEAFKGDEAKMSAVDGFKRSNSFATGMVAGDDAGNAERAKVLVDDFDDAKGLKAEVLTGEGGGAIRDRLRGMSSGHVDNDGQSINAYDALMQRGTREQADALRAEDVKAADVSSIESTRGLENQFELASRNGTEDDQRRVVDELTKRYTAPDANPTQQRNLERSLQRMQVSADRNHGAGSSMSRSISQARTEMETQSGFGTVPPIGEGTNMDTFVNESFAGASPERMDWAMGEYEGAETNITGQVDTLKTERDALVGTAQGPMNERINRKQSQYIAARNGVVQEAYAEARQIESEVAVAEKYHREISANPSESDQAAQEALDHLSGLKDRLNAANSGAESKVEADDKLNQLQDEMADLVERAGNITPESVAGAKKATVNIAKLEAQRSRLADARKRLKAQRQRS